MKIDKTKLQIIEKPESLPHEQIRNLLNKAHDSNPDVKYATSDLTEEELKETLRLGGVVFVALYNDVLVGTLTIDIETKQKWYAKGKISCCRFLGVLPEYGRNGIASKLLEAVIEWAGKNQVETIIWSPASNNYASIALAEKHGFIKADYYHSPLTDNKICRLVKSIPADRLYAFRCRVYYLYRRYIYVRKKKIDKLIDKIKYKIKHR